MHRCIIIINVVIFCLLFQWMLSSLVQLNLKFLYLSLFNTHVCNKINVCNTSRYLNKWFWNCFYKIKTIQNQTRKNNKSWTFVSIVFVFSWIHESIKVFIIINNRNKRIYKITILWCNNFFPSMIMFLLINLY